MITRNRKLRVFASLLLSLGVLLGLAVTGCTDKDRDKNGEGAAAIFEFIRILPPGYEVTDDGQLVDEQGETVDIDEVEPEAAITEPGEYEFPVVGVDVDENGDKEYTDITGDEDLHLELTATDEENIALDGAKLIVGENVQEGATATLTGTYGEAQLTADIRITVGGDPSGFDAIRILPPGYEVDESGQLIDEDGNPVDIDEVAAEFAVTEPGEYQFIVVGVKEDEAGNKTYTDITGEDDLALALETSNPEAIILDGAKLIVSADVQDGDTATITGTFGEAQLTSDIEITVGEEVVPDDYNEIRILPPGYTVEDGQIKNAGGDNVNIEDVETEFSISEPGEYQFTVVGVTEDKEGNRTFTDITGEEDLALALETSNEEAITLDGAVLTVGEGVQEGDTATITGTYGETQLTADIQISVGEEPAADYKEIRILPPGYVVGDSYTIIDNDGNPVDIATLSSEFTVTAPGDYEFIAVGIGDDGEGNTTYTDITSEADLALTLETSNPDAITLSGAKLTVGDTVKNGDTAKVSGTYGSASLSASLDVTVTPAPDSYKEIRILPPNYHVSGGVIKKDSDDSVVNIDDITGNSYSIGVDYGCYYEFIPVGIAEDGTCYDISDDEKFSFELQGEPYEIGDGTVGFAIDSSNHGIVSIAAMDDVKTEGICYLVGHYPGETELSCDVNFTVTKP